MIYELIHIIYINYVLNKKVMMKELMLLLIKIMKKLLTTCLNDKSIKLFKY